jgi:hypothetical protein
MKTNQVRYSLFLVVSFIVYGSALSVTNVQVDSLVDTVTTYGTVWRGIVTYDVAAEADSVHTWLEFSEDNGTTWHMEKIHAVGHVGTIGVGPNRKAQWMVDGDKGPNCRIRVRVNDLPKYYIQKEVTVFDTFAETAEECPKPIPETDPYETIERLVNNKWHDMVLSLPQYKLPFYDNTWSAKIPLDIKTSVALGSDFSVGMARVNRGPTCSPGNTDEYIWATYLKLGNKEYAVVSKASIRQQTDTINKIKNTIEDNLGIPAGNLLINWDHTHYSDCGETHMAATLEAVRLARASAVPARMAWCRISLGAGYNVRRVSQSPEGMTDGPIDGNLYGVFFRDMNGDPIGAWWRFTGHHGRTPKKVSLLMEDRFGGPCAFMQGNAGTCNMWDDYVARANPASGHPATVTDTFMTETLLSRESTLEYKTIGRMGTASAVDAINGIGTILVCAWLIGDLAIPCYTAEGNMEQALYTMARLGYSDNVMPIGYSNGGGGTYYNWGHDLTSVNNPIAWPNHDDKDSVLRNAEATIRCVNILKNLLGH